MQENNIDAAKVTKPIQLLAAWFIGLILINGSFLGAATQISKPEWAPALLVVAAVANVPVFLACLFLLQTKFRPEMQEDEYYAKHLERRWSSETRTETIEFKVNNKQIASSPAAIGIPSQIDQKISQSASVKTVLESYIGSKVRINDLLPDYEKIKSALLRKNVPLGTTFGSNSDPAEVPKQLVISFHRSCDVNYLVQSILVCADSNFRHIDVTESRSEGGSIYIGSYIYNEKHNIPHIDKELIDYINQKNIKTKDIADFVMSKS